MKRYASHFLFLPGYGYLKQYVVEVEEGYVVHIFPLSEEVEDTEWLPGAIILLTEKELKELDIKYSNNLLAIPPASINGGFGLLPVYFSCFDFTTMRPVAGTPHRQLQ